MISPDKCCGCGGCVNICPTNAINMTANADGFSVPIVDSEKCILCNACEWVCPERNHIEKQNYSQKFFAAYINEVLTRVESSSGGIFSALSDYVLENNGYVVGVSMDNDFIARFHIASNKNERNRFLKSKYVQSETGTIYKQVKDLLNQDHLVLFSGLPCQVAALRLFLKREYNNLFTVDLLCHGVTSASLFKDYLKYKERYGNKIISYEFRARDENRGWEKTCFKATYADGQTEVLTNRNDYYWGLFYRRIGHRDSCLNCKYKSTNRLGDITLGDFWGVKEHFPKLDIYNGVSLVSVNSDKGDQLLHNIGEVITMIPCNGIDVVPDTMKSVGKPYRFRKQFFDMYREKGFSVACFVHVFLSHICIKLPLVKRFFEVK